ncbi:ankyrin repeats (3 copies) domain-containing protein [Hirsutella rhossiliensis]|uniref:Ankyrin repeats (3 copies) domain-containing protein n=1 Tax=Hirsutella rhossiliensis TaxID=111463 RepID=A0A9P8MZJ1_9HYPO|nr:ankyrin repeats (3 copies) domain-containing protein [Hirsutella rhossiliensis]KAH0963131.1 ankyrin repeats (3 copies) domain-containing protein [Hirsutella rhossiliensis]
MASSATLVAPAADDDEILDHDPGSRRRLASSSQFDSAPPADISKRGAPANLDPITRYLVRVVQDVRHDVDVVLHCLRDERLELDRRTAHVTTSALLKSRTQGAWVQEILAQGPTSFTRLAAVPDTLSSFMESVDRAVYELLVRRKRSWVDISLFPRQPSVEQWRSQDRLEGALQHLKGTLKAAMPTAMTFGSMVKAGADLEKKSMSLDSSLMNEHGQAHRGPTTESPPGFDRRIRHLATRACRLTLRQDVPGAYANRHKHYNSCRMEDSATWLVENPRFTSWLNDPLYDVFWCHGRQGVGKSVLASAVVDFLQRMQTKHAYFYLGQGKVQTASGLTLALLEQLCAAVDFFPPSLEPSLAKLPFPAPNSETSDAESVTSTRTRPRSVHKRLSIRQGKPLGPEEQTVVPPSMSPQSVWGTPVAVTSSATACLNVMNGAQLLIPGQKRAHTVGVVASRPSVESPVHDSEILSADLSGQTTTNDPPADHTAEEAQANVGQHTDAGLKSKNMSNSTDPVPALHILLDALRATRREFHGEIFLVLDAWDEDNMMDRAAFKDVLRALRRARCKIFLTSRARPDVPQDGGVVQMDMSEGLAEPRRVADVEAYVERLLRNEQQRQGLSLSPELVADCVHDIAKLSEGVFTSANICTLLLLRRQQQGQPATKLGQRALRESLAGLPRSRRKLAKRALSQLKLDSSPLASASFSLMMWLQLSERVHALSTDYGDAFRSVLNEIPWASSQDISYSKVVHMSKPFVTVDPGNGLIHLASSAIAAVVERQVVEFPEVQVAVARAYIDYMDDPSFSNGLCATEEDLVALLREHEFLASAAHWASYCRKVLESSSSEVDAVNQRVIQFLDTQNCRLALQVFLYTHQDLLDPALRDSWDDFATWVATLPRLHIASRLGLAQALEVMLESGAHDVMQQDSRGSTALHEAAKAGSADVVHVLLGANAEMAHVSNHSGRKPLFYAWEFGHSDAFVPLFEAQSTASWFDDEPSLKGVDLNAVIDRYCSIKTAALADAGPVPDARGVALLLAIQNNQPNVADLLIRAGADVNVVFNGTSPLYAAVESKQASLAADLVYAGADPSAKMYDGEGDEREPMLHLVIRTYRPRSLTRSPASSILQSNHLDINCVDSADRTALFVALERDDEQEASEAARLLMRHGLDVDKRDDFGRHALHMAARRGFSHVISDLLFRSRLTEAPKDQEGHTPACYAAQSGHHHVAAMLAAAQGE